MFGNGFVLFYRWFALGFVLHVILGIGIAISCRFLALGVGFGHFRGGVNLPNP